MTSTLETDPVFDGALSAEVVCLCCWLLLLLLRGRAAADARSRARQTGHAVGRHLASDPRVLAAPSCPQPHSASMEPEFSIPWLKV